MQLRLSPPSYDYVNEPRVHVTIGWQGMSLSGADKLEERTALMDGVRALDANAAQHMHICTDTYGAIATASDQG